MERVKYFVFGTCEVIKCTEKKHFLLGVKERGKNNEGEVWDRLEGVSFILSQTLLVYISNKKIWNKVCFEAGAFECCWMTWSQRFLTEAEELISLPYSNTGKKVQALKKYKSKKSPPEPHVI